MIRYGRVKFFVAGLLIVAFGAAILWANRSGRTGEVASELVEVAAPKAENEGKLVMVSGTPELVDGGVIVDEEAGLSVQNALSYSRIPYQKVYAQKSREVVVDKGEDKNDPYDDVTRTEHYIAKTWIIANQNRDEVVSDGFERHENPPASNLSPYHGLSTLRIAGFEVESVDVGSYLHTKNEGFTPEELEQACGEYITRSELDLKAVTSEHGTGMLATGNDIGDVQVLFGYETLEGADPVTLIARQRGDKLVIEEDDLVSTSESTQPGIVSKDEFIHAISEEDASSRRIGIGALVVGAVLVVFSLDKSRSR